uniref:Transmembrane protein n=1 Tax=Parascaris univalens TaxID=6257 RepID=A0A915AU88_PARUN
QMHSGLKLNEKHLERHSAIAMMEAVQKSAASAGIASLCCTSPSFVRLLHTACRLAVGCPLPRCIRYPPRFRLHSSLTSIFYTHECALRLNPKAYSHHLQHSSTSTTTNITLKTSRRKSRTP